MRPFSINLFRAVAFIALILPLAQTPAADPIRPWKNDPRYWEYKGKPLLLLGGSKTDHIFLAEGLKDHLDEIARAGGNYLRNTMSQREPVEMKPHLRLPSGKFDLDKWNPEYWKRFADCLRWCKERDIILQIEVWDRFDFSQEHWEISPWRPDNNINYTAKKSGLANQYPAPPWKDKQPFFHSVPGMAMYKKPLDMIRTRQERFVSKMLSYSLDYGNVLYCMNNETSTPTAWGQYWMRFIREKAKAKGVEVYATDMFDDGWKPQASGKFRQAFKNPKMYPFIEVSQVNSRTYNEDHWKNITWVMGQVKAHPRPVNNTKIYGGSQHYSFGTGKPADGVERFWRNIIAGCASVRFHRPDAGNGFEAVAQASIRAMRHLEKRVPLWSVEPNNALLKDRQKDEAYLAARRGKAYALYFTDGGEVGLDLRKDSGKFNLQWIDIGSGNLGGQKTIQGGAIVKIAAPKKGGWAAAIVKK